MREKEGKCFPVNQAMEDSAALRWLCEEIVRLLRPRRVMLFSRKQDREEALRRHSRGGFGGGGAPPLPGGGVRAAL